MAAQKASPVNSHESSFFTTISLILAKNNCKLVDIDFEKGNFNISGRTPENIKNCYDDIQLLFMNHPNQ